MSMTASTVGPAPDHAEHDPLLVVRANDGETLTDAETTALTERLASCAACRALQVDLLALSAALRTDLPTPRRTRDFRLSPETASMHGPSWLERLSGLLSGPALRPLATAMCAIGLLLAVSGAVLPRVGSTATAALQSVGGAVTDTTGERAQAPDVSTAGPAPATTPMAGAAGAVQSPGEPVSAPSPLGADYGPAGSPHPTAGPLGPASLPKAGGAGDVTSGGIPPGVPVVSPSAGLDPWTLVMVAGVIVLALGLGGLLVARRRPSPLP